LTGALSIHRMRSANREGIVMRVAIIGLGSIAHRAYLPMLTTWEGLELMVCSRRQATLQRVQAEYRLPRGSTDLEEVLRWQPAAAVVLTPNDTHMALAARLLQGGVDVLVEKPPTLSSGEARDLATLADAQQRVLMVSYNRRYAPLHVQARAVWGGRTVGLCLMEKHRATAAHVNLSDNYVDDTIHIIDLLRFFCGEATAVRTAQQVRDGRLVGAVSVARLAGGGLGVVMTSLQAGQWTERYSLFGDQASMHVDAFSRVRLVTPQGEQMWRNDVRGWMPVAEMRGFAAQVAHFFECVRTRQQPQTSGWEAYKTQVLLEEMVARAE
jgi:virulence factor